MKEIQLTQNYVAFIDDNDYERVSMFDWHAAKTQDRVYAQRSFKIGNKFKPMKLAVFILGIQKLPNTIAHLDGDGLNCQRENLRITTKSNQYAKKRLQSSNTSGYRGIGLQKPRMKWKASIKCNKKVYFLGYFNCKQCAASAYNKAARQHFGEFARLNNIEQHDCGKFGEEI